MTLTKKIKTNFARHYNCYEVVCPGVFIFSTGQYGEGQLNDKEHNLRGQLYQHYDGGGLQQIRDYDFKGNALATLQQLLEDPTLTDGDYAGFPAPAISTEVFSSAVAYDALNRPVSTTDPGGNVQEFTYDKGGLLKTVTLNSEDYVEYIHYNSKGQREAIKYGNGTKTSYTYDEFTFRLRNLVTRKSTTDYQNLYYYYDPVGNITTIKDDAQQILFFKNSVVSPTQGFTYDALYRLTEAKGRELIGTANFGSDDNWNDRHWKTTHKGNGNAVQNYTQQYTYDEVGNILELQHIAGTASYTRTYDIDQDSNRLLSTTVGANTYDYDYDVRGNIVEMPHLDAMLWNIQNELHHIERGTSVTDYQYSSGQRIRKYRDYGSEKEERIYLGNYEIYRKYDNTDTLIIERTTVHVSDDTGRIAMLETRTFGHAEDDNDTAEELVRYVYSNHLQSASLELDDSANIISYEEYHPYGTTSYQAMNASINAVAKWYRYTGKERDEESGLYYHGARYYIPWLARWSASDPLESKYAGMSPYNYSFNNPVVWNDLSGAGPGEEDVISGGTLKEVVVTAEARKEGQQRDKSIPQDAPIALVTYAKQRFHLGSEGHSRGWYSEESYVSINKEAMLGMLHGLLGEGGGIRIAADFDRAHEALQKADMAALQFLDKNRDTLSPDFFSLLSSAGREIVKDFNWEYGGRQSGVVYLSDSPIDYFAGGILKGLGNAVARGATLFRAEVEAGIATMNSMSVASTKRYAIAGLENMLQESIENAGANAAGSSSKIAVQFGKTENQIYHAFRHTDALGLDRSLVQSTIQNHFKTG